MSLEIVIRSAVIRDSKDLSILHYDCFREQTSYMTSLGDDFIKSCYQWFICSPRTHVLVASIDDKIIGALISSDMPYSGPMLWACKHSAIIGFLKKPQLLFHPDLMKRLFKSLFKKEIVRERRAIYGVYGMVSPQYTRLGVFTQLRKKMISVCRNDGYEIYISAGIRKNNLASIKAWQKIGGVENKNLETKNFCFWYKSLN